MTSAGARRVLPAFALAAALAALPAIYVRVQTNGFSGGWISRMISGCGGMMGSGTMGAGGIMGGGMMSGGASERPNRQWRH